MQKIYNIHREGKLHTTKRTDIYQVHVLTAIHQHIAHQNLNYRSNLQARSTVSKLEPETDQTLIQQG